MHTFVVFNDAATDIRIHHNGDWSGEAILQYQDEDETDGECTLRIPGWVAEKLCVELAECGEP